MARKNKSKTRDKEQFNYDPPFESEEQDEKPRPKYRTKLVYLIDQDEVNRLIEASNAVYVEPPGQPRNQYYSTYTQEECNALIAGMPMTDDVPLTQDNSAPRKLKKKK